MIDQSTQPRKRISSKELKEYQPLLAQAEEEMLGNGESLQNTLSAVLSGIMDRDRLPSPVFTRSDLWQEVKRTKLVSLLRFSAHNRHVEAFKYILSFMLIELDIKIPQGVIMRFKKDPGRSGKDTVRAICAKWEADGCPKITSELCAEYAAMFYPSKYAKAKPNTKPYKNLIAQIRTPLLKHQKKLAATNCSR